MRYGDEQLYALALYIYSLKPPPNPNPVDDRARRGEKVFRREGCAGCHTPPFIRTTSSLRSRIPSTGGFAEDRRSAAPRLQGQRRIGWYRNAFSHTGQAETLEEWLDPARLKTDYVPRGFHISPGPIRGHEFGLKLSSADREDLIAFLKTLKAQKSDS